ncbi:LacI family DNA-binding transcriptional regulator [Melissococcus sp. OM08-11BH]|uniref:LacI family DNA-binding transcriptional regulator n=1 Tax=Melissococcus sp. OM08-11BH TaxID=2293110 RepID=UPI000E4C673D|nr:LacI family DNA-binding transcriptional regulator [Melissococcus sp. OM08-11BH]RGI31857.1 LacI family DNA-binding transcriptional regulator [Melissococcus sp. OM08-11BH]
MENQEVRTYIAINLLKYWEVANKIGISDATFSRWLRTPLSEERKKRVLEAIEELKKEVN